jgi:hypothetical protein
VELVFVPRIGFRPAGTRVLRHPVETTADGTRLMVLSVAAAPDRTDLVIEWERRGDPASCSPDSQLLMHSNMAPLEKGLSAALVLGTNRLPAITMRRRAMQMSLPLISAVDVLTFAEMPRDAHGVELHISEGGSDWRVPVDLIPGQVNATPLAVEVARDGIVVRATAVGRSENKLVIELEVAAPTQIRQAGAPMPSPARFSSTSDDDHVERIRESRRFFGEFFGDQLRPITLEVEDGARIEEVARLFSLEPQQAATGRHPYVSRFVVAFDAPSTDAKRATLVIPFVELNDFAPSTTADLRELPLDVALAEHRFRVVAVEPHGTDQRKITIELPPSTAAPRFVQPARLHGSDPQFGWERHAVDAKVPDRDAIWMATKVGDPPIVTFTGAVMRVDGPLRLELPLT